MSSGYRNNLAKQMAEHLVCVELGRQDLVATPFSGNVPVYDVLIADAYGNALSAQVKATRGTTWQSDARRWMHIELDPETGVQNYESPIELHKPELLYFCVTLAPLGDESCDHIFILTAASLQSICINNYVTWMESRGWKRPRNVGSFDLRYSTEDLKEFEDNWNLIHHLLKQEEAIEISDLGEFEGSDT